MDPLAIFDSLLKNLGYIPMEPPTAPRSTPFTFEQVPPGHGFERYPYAWVEPDPNLMKEYEYELGLEQGCDHYLNQFIDASMNNYNICHYVIVSASKLYFFSVPQISTEDELKILADQRSGRLYRLKDFKRIGQLTMIKSLKYVSRILAHLQTMETFIGSPQKVKEYLKGLGRFPYEFETPSDNLNTSWLLEKSWDTDHTVQSWSLTARDRKSVV